MIQAYRSNPGITAAIESTKRVAPLDTYNSLGASLLNKSGGEVGWAAGSGSGKYKDWMKEP